MSKPDVATLKRKRGSDRAKVTLFRKFIDNVKTIQSLNSVQLTELKNRLTEFKLVYPSFDETQTLIESIDDISEVDEVDPVREQFENDYHLLVAVATELIRKHDPEDSEYGTVTGSQRTPGGNKSFIKLPTIDLPHFSGEPHDWLEYKETFESLINSHQTIDNIQKFHYLRASLRGSASLVIKSLEMTADNYPVAWKLVCERYDNKRQLISNHVQALFNINNIHKESSVSLRQLLDTIHKNIRALSSLGEQTDHWDTLIIYLVASKLDSKTLRHWEEHKNNLTTTSMPTLECLYQFLKNRADLLETIEKNQQKTDTQSQKNTNQSQKYTSQNTVPTCSLCKAKHFIFSCSVFRQMPVEARIKEVEKLKICSNCLHPGHDNRSCRGGSCKYCKSKHNTLLHLEKADNITLTSTQNKSQLLSTVQVKVFSKDGVPHTVRALLDNASTSCYISNDLRSKLNLHVNDIDTSVTGIGNQTLNITQQTSLDIHSLYNNYKTNVSCFVVNTISASTPHTFFDIDKLNIPQHIQLADPNFNIPAPVDLLLGLEIFWDVLGSGKIPLGNKSQPCLRETELGWLVAGTVTDVQGQNFVHNQSQDSCFFVSQISNQLTRFWEVENISTPTDVSPCDQQTCEEIFTKTTTRKDDGRFVVTIPFKQPPESLGDSYNLAKNRFLTIEKRFQKEPMYKEQYIKFMTEYLDLGHMTKNTNTQKSISQKPSCFVPHFGIIREASSTTKFRTVFDAAALTSNKISLNDIQMIGPIVQDDLISILIRFRQHKFIVSADIEKMYRQIEITEKQRPLQQIVFRFDPSEQLQTYTLNTVTYGTASAPFLATRCIKQVGLECHDSKEAQEVILHDFYCDDLLSGADDESSLLHIITKVNKALKSAQFPLRKWQSNHPDILHKAALNSDSSRNTLNLGTNDQSKTLGIYWNTKQDTITYTTNTQNSVDSQITKRKILSTIGQIFDPLGLISPCILEAKIIMQQIWLQNIQWDSKIPEPMQLQWIQFVASLSALNQLIIPRRAFYDSHKTIQLHIFCDASQDAYGSCVYVRTQTNNNEIHVQLLTAKCRVAPLKKLTVPRLELCAALTAVRLYEKVIDSIRNPHLITKCVFWSDSMIVLSWIKSPSHKLNTFVSHRINEIQKCTNQHTWRYVPTKQNPADLISRGVRATQLIHSDMWFSGPEFLKNDEKTWPQSPGHLSDSELPETKPQTYKNTNNYCYTQIDNENSYIYKYSNFSKLTRITAYILRFINKCKTKSNKIKSQVIDPLTTQELYQARIQLVKISQLSSFKDEYESLRLQKKLSHKNRLNSLNPFYDGTVIRVGGRIAANTRFHYDKKFPLLLDANHHISKLIFTTYHTLLLHAGPQLLLAHIRETYWPLGGRNLARKTVKSCITCRRYQGRTITPQMGSLPEPRLHADFAFLNVGVDYTGEIMISNRRGRGSQLIKAYICVFVCFAVKAVHLELVTDLTKESYLAALDRFIYRRGKPANIYSDNGTNFVGASNIVTKLLAENQNYIQNSIAEQGIRFHFIPPYTPHFGGLWESSVKSVKHLLKRVLGSAHLTYEETYTALVQIEGILNSRPLTPLSTDPSDLTALTPFHFLIGRTLTVIPHPQIPDCNPLHLPRYKRVEQIRQHFWSRYYKEYISQLQTRIKWQSSTGTLKEGMLVVVKQDNVPPVHWILGRVTKLHPGSDGVARVAEIKTKAGTIRRAFNRICPLTE